MLTLARNTRLSTNKITLRHYVNGVHISDYVLELKIGMGIQETREYVLPPLENGKVEVIVELEDELNSSVIIVYNQARDLYENGLLIYFTDNDSMFSIVNGEYLYDRYVYFASGKEDSCYFREAFSSEWVVIDNAPPLKRFAREEMGYIPSDGRQEYEWVKYVFGSATRKV
jgi:hypothetical protein